MGVIRCLPVLYPKVVQQQDTGRAKMMAEHSSRLAIEESMDVCKKTFTVDGSTS